MSRRKGPVFSKYLVIFILAALCIVGLGIYQYRNRPYPFDATLQKTFTNASNTHSYEEYVQTRDTLSGRTLQVDGTYLLDTSNGRYASFSTTTLTSNGSKPIIFTLANISIGSDLYTRVETASKITLAVPSSSAWQHFQATNIPVPYDGIAIPGALLDNLKLFGNGGRYLTAAGGPVSEKMGSTTLTRYTFKLSSAASAQADGTLGALASRIGKDGSIDIWIDPSSATIRYMRFHNGAYVSTTTISDINGSLMIEPPVNGG